MAGDPTGTWTRMITDPVTGGLLDYGRTTYRPPANLRDFILLQGRGVLSPRVYPGGGALRLRTLPALRQCTPTSTARPARRNNAACCRRHHRCKTLTPWQYTINPDGSFTWTSPDRARLHQPTTPTLAPPHRPTQRPTTRSTDRHPDRQPDRQRPHRRQPATGDYPHTRSHDSRSGATTRGSREAGRAGRSRRPAVLTERPAVLLRRRTGSRGPARPLDSRAPAPVGRDRGEPGHAPTRCHARRTYRA